MKKQIEILNRISSIGFEIAVGDYDEIVISAEIDAEGGSAEFVIYQRSENEKTYPEYSGLLGHDLMMLSFDLHEAMKAHTGGDLKKYTVRIDGEGEATVDFEYHQPGD